MTRREWMRATTATLIGLGAAGCALPGRPGGAGRGSGAGSTVASGSGSSASGGGGPADRVLVLVVMAGGNDGLNAVIPYEQGQYYDSRPTIAIPQKQVLPLAGGMGLHPALSALLPLYKDGTLTVVQGVGYPNPILSHFRSMAIWQTAQPDVAGTTGWLGRYLDQTASAADDPLRAVAIGATVPVVLVGQRTTASAIESLPAFQVQGDPRYAADADPLRAALSQMYLGTEAQQAFGVLRTDVSTAYAAAAQLQAASGGYKPGQGVSYPNTGLAADLQMVVRLLAGGVRTQVFTVGLGGFDDHADEHAPYTRLLTGLGDALAAFQQDLTAHGLAERVLTVCFSEFGRRVRENASGGTDHGTAGPMFLLGPALRGGLYGQAPDLASLDSVGDLKYTLDFRDVFGTVLDGWLDGPAKTVLGGSYGGLNLLRA